MKSFKQFISESINISGDFNGNLYMNSDQPDQSSFGEGYTADVLWNGNLYRMELVSENGIPSRQKLGEQLQGDYPGAVVHQIYQSMEKNTNVRSTKRYHPSKLEWID